LQARFMSWLQYAIGNIRRGKVPRLSQVEQRPQNTVSIGQGRGNSDDISGEVSPESISGRIDTSAAFEELLSDITELLRKRERQYDFPLVRLFQR